MSHKMKRPGTSVTLIGLTPDARRAGWPVPERSGLERFRTVAFGVWVMESQIGFAVGGVLYLGLWIDAVVPECYRAAVRAIVGDPVWFEPFRGQKATDDLLRPVIHELTREIWGRLEPFIPGSAAGGT